jgi:lauroyl/myristoyl acyltransferase
MSHWKKLRHRLEELGCRALMAGIPKLSRLACVRLGNALGELAYRVDARGRSVALSNLECVFGGRFTLAERREIVRASYRNFLRTMIDLFWAQRLTPENYRDFMHAEGFEEIRERLAREKRGTIFMCVHQGNWEWASLVCGYLGFGNVVVAENFKNPRLTEVFSTLRQHSGQTIIPQENSLLRMLKIVKRGGATGMLIDLNLRPSQAATVIEGYGLKMCVPLLHAVLAQRVGALLVVVETWPRPDGTCSIIARAVETPEGASVAEISQRCWDAFEPILRTNPESWLWPYKHFRYKPRDATRPYPTYANESAKFEKLLREISK